MFIIRKMVVNEQNWPWKKSSIFRIEKHLKVIQFVYVSVISVKFTINASA